MSNVMIIIQARMTSTRLPGKVLLPLYDKPILQVMIERLPNLRKNIIVATTNDGTEQPIVDLCHKLNIRTYRGSTHDVLGRYHDAAKYYDANENTTIVRLTSDCPFIDEDLCKQVIDCRNRQEYDMVNLGPHSGFPRGLDCCAFSFDLLRVTHERASLPADREHVTLGMAKFSSVSTFTYSAHNDYSHYRLTLDEKDDYLAITAIYHALGNNVSFSYAQLLSLLDKRPELSEINRHVEQKPT